MIRSVLAVFVGLLSSYAIAQTAGPEKRGSYGFGAVPNPVYGTWISNVMMDKGHEIRMLLKFAPGKFTAGAECRMSPEKTVKVETTVKAIIEQAKFTVLEENSNVEKFEGKNCNVSIEKMENAFRVEADKLILIADGRERVYTRVK